MPIGHLRSTGFNRNRALVCERFPPKGGTTNQMPHFNAHALVLLLLAAVSQTSAETQAADQLSMLAASTEFPGPSMHARDGCV